MTRVCLLVPSLQTGDAIGHDVAAMYDWCRHRGLDTHVVAQHWRGDVGLPIESLERYAHHARSPDTLTIYHHSTFWADAADLFIASAGPKILRYHAITPPAFFLPYNAELVHTTSQGRRQTATLVRSGRIDLFLGDSVFNVRELQSTGAPAARCRVVPPFTILPELGERAADLGVLERYVDDTYNVLFVGRVVPNKGHRHLLGVIGAYRRLFGRPIRLIVVGALDERVREYHEELTLLARGLRIADATVWTDRVSPAELKAYYLSAHAFLVMSEHEGFCVPVVEAMAHDVPVIASASSAVSETVGEAGLLLDGLDYDEYAAALDLVFERPQLRDEIIARQREALATRFSAAGVARSFADALAPWLSSAFATALGDAPASS